MPIKRVYLPPFADVLDAAQQVGAGQYEQQRRREDLALLEIGQRDLAQRRAIAADQERQAAAIVANQQEQAARLQLAGWQAALNEKNIVRGHQWDLDKAALDREQHLADVDAANAEWFDRAQFGFENQWGLQAIEAQEKGLNADLAGLLKAKDQLTQEGVNILGKLLGKSRAIQGQRANMPPAEYGRILSEFADEVQRSGVHEHIKAPPTPEQLQQQFESETVTIPTGPFKGVYGRDRSGSWRQVGKPEKPVENKTPATFEDRYKDFEDFQKDFDAESKRLFQERKDSAGEDETPKPPTRDEVIKSMREKFEAYKSLQPKTDNVSVPPPEPVEAPQVAQSAPAPRMLVGNVEAGGLVPVLDSLDQVGASGLRPNDKFMLPDARLYIVDGSGKPRAIGRTGQLPPVETVLPVAEDLAKDLTDQEIEAHLASKGFPQGTAQIVEREAIAKHQAEGHPDPVAAAAVDAIFDAKQPLPPEPKPVKVEPTGPIKLRSDHADEDYKNVHAGQLFVDPNGEVRRKPYKALKTPPKQAAIEQPKPEVAQPEEEAVTSLGGKSLVPNKPDEVRTRSFKRDENGLVKQEVETWIDPTTGETVTQKQIIDRDEDGRIVSATVFVKRKKAEA